MCGERSHFYSASLPLATEKSLYIKLGGAVERVQRTAFLFVSAEMHDLVNGNRHFFSQWNLLPDNLICDIYNTVLGGGAWE